VCPSPAERFILYVLCERADRQRRIQHQWRVLWNAGGDTGYRTFNPGNNAYAFLSNSAHGSAGSNFGHDLFSFRRCGIPSQSATIKLDDVSLSATNGMIGAPEHESHSGFHYSGIGYPLVCQQQCDLSGPVVQRGCSEPTPSGNNLGSPIAGNGATNTVFGPRLGRRTTSFKSWRFSKQQLFSLRARA